MKQTKKLSRKVISYVLALVMVLSTMTGIVPGMSITAQAAEKSVTFTNNGTQDGITVNGKYQRGRTGNHFFINSGVILTISSGNDNIITKLEITDSKVYSGRFTESHITVSTGNKSIQDSVLTVTDVNAKSVTLSATDSLYWTTNKIVVYYAEGNTKTAQTVNPPTAASDLTYKKGQAQALLTSGASVTTGNTAEGSIQYRVGTEGTWSTKIPTGTNAGTYDVYYKVLEDETYAEYAPTTPISVTIAKADPETPTGITAKYGDDTSKIKLPEGWTWNDWHYFGTVGKDTVKADFAGNDNYNAKTGVDITVEVGKADVAISYEKTEVSVEYGAEFGKNEITNPGNAEPTFTSTNESVATVSDSGYVTIKGLGETTITATIEDNEHYHYTTAEASYKLTVNPVTTVVNTAPTAAELTYGQKLSESTLTGGVAVSHGSSVAGTFAWKEPDLVPNASESGEYDAVFTPTDTNYGKSTCKVTIKVNKKTVSVKDLEDAQKPVAKTGDDTVYTGEPIELVTAPTADLPLDYEAYYSTDDGDSWSTDIPKKTDPGTYTIKVKYVSAGKNCNDIILDDITATITPADKKALTDAIAAAKAYYDTIKGNTDYSEASDKLDKAIKAAEEVAAKNKLTKSEVSTAAEALNTAKATAEAEVKDIDDTKAAQAVIDKINELKPVENIKPEDRTKIEAAREAYKKLSDDQKTKLTGLDSTAVSTLEAAEQVLDTAEKAAFDDEKEAEKKAADNFAADGDSDASKKLIEDAKKAIDELAYDETKSLDENKAALAAIVSKLKDDLTTQRAADKKEADDTAAAKKVTDAINALPASDKVATTDKAAIEAARKAYDALTADQKAKVSAETLKKLEEAEKALAAAEKKAADDAKKSEGKNEWIDGQWYGADGNTEYKAKGSWKQNDKGWWYEDTDGWYPKSQWQKIDGLWYYFGVSGYMAASEWIDGWWCDADGAWRYEPKGSWKQDSTGWWYEDTAGWYPQNQWQKIDNVWYYFGADGYLVTNQYVGEYWVNANGEWAE